MTNILLALILLLLAGICALGVGFLRVMLQFQAELSRAKQKAAQIQERIEEFYTAPADSQPSELGKVIDHVARAAGRSAAMEIKTTLMGEQSGKSRAIEGMAHDLVEGEQPALAGMIDALPKGAKRAIAKNPGIFSLLLEKFGPSLLNINTGSSTGSGNGGSAAGSAGPRFKF